MPHPRLVLFPLAALCAAAALAAPAAGPPNRPEIEKYPNVSIGNGTLTLHLFIPDPVKGYYRGARFDWSGIIGRAELGGHHFYGEWRGPHNPTNHDDITGPAEEFGQPPIAWDETPVGQPFIKIGVGEARKTETGDYHFSGEYPIVKTGRWSAVRTDRTVQFVQELKDERGWAYRYSKRVEVDRQGSRFTISHRLENTGTKTIDQNHYCHNFTSIDDAPIGPAYRITLPFAVPRRIALGEAAQPVGQIEGKVISFSKPIPTGGSVQSLLHGWGDTPTDNAFTVENTETGAGIRMQGDMPLIRYNFWSASTAACPEPFIQIHLPPGETKAWVNRYELYVRNP